MAQPKSNAGLLWALAGGGVLVIALVTVVVLYATGVFGGSGHHTATQSTSPSAQPQGPTSPVTGTITDAAAGLTYPQLGGNWQPFNPSGSFAQLGFSKGEAAVVQDNYDGQGHPYLANASSGTLAPSVQYSGTDQLESAAKGEFAALEPSSYSSHGKQDLTSAAMSIDGKHAWIYKVRLDFPQAAASNWNWRTETAVIIVVDHGSSRPGVLYISIPDSHKNQGDLDLLVAQTHAQ